MKKRSLAILGTFLTFAIGYVTVLIPSLAANLVNAGGVFTTTYGSQDVVLPDLTFSIAHRYAAGLQGLLILWVVLPLVRDHLAVVRQCARADQLDCATELCDRA